MPIDCVHSIARKLIEHYREHDRLGLLQMHIAAALLRERDPVAYALTLDFSEKDELEG